MKVLDLFSGIGGFSVGLERAGFQTVAFCEVDEFCQKVLTKNFPSVPIFNDIKTLTKEKLNEQGIGQIDLICGGFPCQPFSNAGKKKGRQDDRDLWPEMFRVIKETKPTWVIGENVAGFISMEFTRTKIDLESIGYRVLPFTIPACAVGANHRRDRIWIIAHLDCSKLRIESGRSIGQSGESSRISGDDGQERLIAYINSDGLESDLSLQAGNEGASSSDFRIGEKESITNPDSERAQVLTEREHAGIEDDRSAGQEESAANSDGNGLIRKANAAKKKNNKREWESGWWTKAAADFGYWWPNQPGMGRAVHGFSTRVDRFRRKRIKALGNAVVPQIPELIGRYIMEIEE